MIVKLLFILLLLIYICIFMYGKITIFKDFLDDLINKKI